MKYTLINNNDCRDTIEFTAGENEDPISIALEVLGWSLVAVVDPDDNQPQLDL